ncbi:hypothetical protein NDI56_08575 [Haloarcula sp. S1CR25-12]|uniref:Uncharacterized protein n=1 Tax=Haloarcula saliterrae TaxID=2950534 RepID=A0ABU2FCK3_9EURY|nr:hypothetical protein [Haloarcula sp. S1CR25-12]MDS0259445.1 hypothetical protein [Haloarcula sp. S1CR25-12]
MDRLSSCYFCGGALDASLSEYPVVPKALRSAGDDGPTVVLCSTCRRKLGAVIETVVAATEDDSAAERGDPEQDDIAGASDTQSAERTDGSLLDAAAGADADTAAPADGSESPTSDGTAAPEPADDAEPTTTAGSSGDGSERGSDDGDPQLTKLEYNKVMRLLQNRPFPVDRAEIREVATSAYDIDPGEFDAVIDAAVSRELIAVENGQFVDPD